MNPIFRPTYSLAALVALALAGPVAAFESGSTGADGALNPTVNTQIPLPPNGVLNYTNVNIPAGVTVTFAKNTTNTPVVILVGGDATIAGSISVSGSGAAATGAAGDGNIGDDGMPGRGGPGGFDGGQGGRVDANAALRISQAGVGPGGAGASGVLSSYPCGGSGGGFGAVGGHAGSNSGTCAGASAQGKAYGAPGLLPLVGGSGGSGGAGGTIMKGAGGGGGGGAVMIAVSGTLSVTGAIHANGGAGGTIAGSGVGAAGGGGSGGAIRLVATAISGNGVISAVGGGAQRTDFNGYYWGGHGSVGRIRMESETITRTASSTPVHTFGEPGAVFVAGLPSLRITRVAGVDAPASPTGNADIALPEDTVNPVAVDVATTGVPLGNTVSITVTPAFGAATTHVSNALSGTEGDATAIAAVTLPPGPSTLLATVSYSVPEEVAMQSPYREMSGDDDLIERISLQAAPDGSLKRIATTRSGREIDLSSVALGG